MRLSLFLPLLALALPADVGASGGIQPLVRVARDAEWIAAGMVARKTDKGFFAALTAPLKGSPPDESFITHWVPQVPDKTLLIAYGTTKGPSGYLFQRFDIARMPQERWLAEARFTIEALLRLLAAESCDERTQVLREMVLTGYSEALFAVDDYWHDHPEAASYSELVPALLQTIKTTKSGTAANHAAFVLVRTARPEDLPDVITILERDDPAFWAKMLPWIDKLTSPTPPPADPKNAVEAARVIQERRAWYAAHKKDLRLRGRPPPGTKATPKP